MLSQLIRTRVLKNGTNGWYWEVITKDRQVLDRGVTNSIDAARTQADQARYIAAQELNRSFSDRRRLKN